MSFCKYARCRSNTCMRLSAGLLRIKGEASACAFPCKLFPPLHFLLRLLRPQIPISSICARTSPNVSLQASPPLQGWFGVAARRRSGNVCAVPSLITSRKHTCANRCPPGLPCCSSLGWSVCLWRPTTHPQSSSSPVFLLVGRQ